MLTIRSTPNVAVPVPVKWDRQSPPQLGHQQMHLFTVPVTKCLSVKHATKTAVTPAETELTGWKNTTTRAKLRRMPKSQKNSPESVSATTHPSSKFSVKSF